MLSRWLSCTTDNSIPHHRFPLGVAFAPGKVSPRFAGNPGLSLSDPRHVIFASLTISRGTTSNVSQQLELGSTRGIHRPPDPATAAGLPNDGPRPLDDLPARSRAPVPVPGADRGSCRRVGRVGGAGMARGTHPASPRGAWSLLVPSVTAAPRRTGHVHRSGAAVPSTSMSSAITCTAPSSVSPSSMGANAGLFGFSTIRVCRHVSPSPVFSLSYRFTV